MLRTWSEADIPDQRGRVAVVTGANGGLGLETARALADHGAHVVMAARDQAKAAAAEAAIRAEAPGASLEVVPVDLADQSTVRDAAAAIAERHPHIDLLVNNAGLMAMPEGRTADGYETQLGVNHLGHWTFTAGLLAPIVRAADEGRHPRVVTLTSIARFVGGHVDTSNPHLEGRYDPWRAYGQAKLANLVFGIGLQRQFEQADVDAASLLAHPGLSRTDLQRRTHAEGGAGILGPFSERLAAVAGMPPRAGARMQLRAAIDPGARGGELSAPAFASFGPAVARPVLRPDLDERIAQLWELSERETGVALDVAGAVADVRG
jgi:NAD(P)-dependent dehydrogenase (short-subunit alcohol dehydrogenase family)